MTLTERLRCVHEVEVHAREVGVCARTVEECVREVELGASCGPNPAHLRYVPHPKMCDTVEQWGGYWPVRLRGHFPDTLELTGLGWRAEPSKMTIKSFNSQNTGGLLSRQAHHS